MAQTDPNTYEVGIDLGNDGTWSGADLVEADVVAREHLEYSFGRDQVRLLSPPQAGVCRFALANDANQWDTSSALAPRLPIRIRVTQAGPTTRVAWIGDLEQATQRPNIYEQMTVIDCVGKLARLTRNRGHSTQVYTDITTGTAIQRVMEAAGLAAADFNIADTGQTSMAYWWLDEQETPWSAIQRILDTEGRAYLVEEPTTGAITFRDRHSRFLDSNSTSVQSTLRGSTTEPIFSSFEYDDGVRDIINQATMVRRVRTAQTLAAIWTHDGNFTAAPGSSTAIKVRMTSSNPFTAAVSPLVADTDYTIVSGTVSSATLDRTSGSSATLTIVAGGTGVLELSGLQVRGQELAVTTEESFTNTIDASASITANGIREWAGNPRAEISAVDAQDLVNGLVSAHLGGRPRATVTLHGRRATDTMTAALTRNVGDRVALHETRSALAGTEFWIEHVRHIVRPGRDHVTTFGMERADAANYWILGTDSIGTPGETAVLGW